MDEKNIEGRVAKADCQSFVIPPDLEEALQYFNARFVDGFSAEEFANSRGYGTNWGRIILKRLVLAGIVKYVGRRTGTRIDGARCMIPVYRVVSHGGIDTSGNRSS